MNLAKQKRIVNRKLLDQVMLFPCTACGAYGKSDPAHIKSRGAGGHDIEVNVLPLCRQCHSAQHARGWMWMMETYPGLNLRMQALGWTWEYGKLFHPALSSEY